MPRLRIVAQGKSDNARAQARGKLFEKIVAEVMRRHGYIIDSHRANVNYSGMEIDIEGKTSMTDIPVYAECKCYSSAIGCEKLQTFMGKYMPRWFKNDKCHGLFVALPGVNSHAMGYYHDNFEANDKITVRLLQEPEVLDALIQGKLVVDSEEINRQVDPSIGSAGDTLLVCSDKGYFWLQHIVPLGTGIATALQIFDADGHLGKDLSVLLPIIALLINILCVSFHTLNINIIAQGINIRCTFELYLSNQKQDRTHLSGITIANNFMISLVYFPNKIIRGIGLLNGYPHQYIVSWN